MIYRLDFLQPSSSIGMITLGELLEMAVFAVRPVNGHIVAKAQASPGGEVRGRKRGKNHLPFNKNKIFISR